MTLEDFVRVEWKPNAELALKKKSVSYYESQLDTRILPAPGNTQPVQSEPGADRESAIGSEA
jgi:hypothetical protein